MPRHISVLTLLIGDDRVPASIASPMPMPESRRRLFRSLADGHTCGPPGAPMFGPQQCP